jgi:hypothetical protein
MQDKSNVTAAVLVFVNECNVWFVWKENVTKKWDYSHFDTYPVMNALKECKMKGLEQMRKTGNEKQTTQSNTKRQNIFLIFYL